VEESVHNLCNRFGSNRIGKHMYGFKNIELVSEISAQEWFDGARELKARYPDRYLIGSIMADAKDYDGWIRLTRGCQEAGMDMVELNFSCPNGYPERGKGCAIGQDEHIACEIVRHIKADPRITVPIAPKLTSAVTDIVFIGEELARAGADAFCAINTVPSLLGFDLSRMTPKVNVNGHTASGGYSGYGIKPIALRCVHELVGSPGLPVMGCGGCMNGDDAVEFLLLGAPVVQLATAVMFEGFALIDRLKKDMIRFMDGQGYDSVNDVVGAGHSRIISFDQLDAAFETVAQVDMLRCTRCGKCETACQDGAYQAIGMAAPGAYPTIDHEKCVGCSLCAHVCPFDAIQMVERNQPLELDRKTG
ncbi:MAG: 4Fe-4S dicluster domain-containing protein, partial [Spartobacteria bacterium]|nr:4Fe-4S dicluster domain-containing protein [Spartobacteria bacterium]